MNLILDKDYSLIHKNSLDIWVSQLKRHELYTSHGLKSHSTMYVSVKCNLPLRKFVTFGQIQGSSDISDETVVVSDLKFDTNMVVENNAEVELVYIDLAEIKEAHSLTIKLNEEEVSNWSEDEEKFSANVIRGQNDLAFLDQNIWIKPQTQRPTLAKVIGIYPKQTGNNPYRITNDTNIVFEGLPLDNQKVIDFSKIGGLDNVISSLREIIQVPLLYPDLLNKFDITPPRGLLLHGPPGNGKTLIARSIAFSLGSKFISIQGPEFTSKYVGEGERRLRDAFNEASSYKNSVIFIDEIDSIASSRDKSNAEHNIAMVSTLLNLMDGISKNSSLFVIGATNRIDALDSAIRRPGRFELEFEIQLPNKHSRLDILSKTIPLPNDKKYEQDINDNFLKNLASRTNGYSGADLISLYRQSAMNSIRRSLTFNKESGKINLNIDKENVKISLDDVNEAFKKIVPTESRSVKVEYDVKDWQSLVIPSTLRSQLISEFKLDNDSMNEKEKSFKNIILEGITGSGKATILRSLAGYNNIEYFEFNILSYINEEKAEILERITNLIRTASLVFPSIVYLQGVKFYPDLNLIIEKVCFEIKKVKSYSNLIFCLESLDKSFSNNCLDYDKFDVRINFNDLRTNELQDELFKKLHLKLDENELSKTPLALGRIIEKMKNEK